MQRLVLSCGDQPILFDATGTAGSAPISGYQWSGPNGYTATGTNPILLPANPSYPGSGTHTYSVTVTDTNGCTGTDEVDVTINANPTVSADATTGAVCGDQPILFDAVGTAGTAAISGYAWSGPGGFSDTGTNPVLLPTDPEYPGTGTHTYTVTVTDNNGCTGTATVDVTINANPSVLASVLPLAACGDEAIDLSAAGTAGSAGITGYAWAGPNGYTSNSQNPSILPSSGFYPSAGVHTYSVTVTDANNCTGTSTVEVTVNALPSVTADVAAPQVCRDESIVFSATSVQGSAPVTGLCMDWTCRI